MHRHRVYVCCRTDRIERIRSFFRWKYIPTIRRKLNAPNDRNYPIGSLGTRINHVLFDGRIYSHLAGGGRCHGVNTRHPGAEFVIHEGNKR